MNALTAKSLLAAGALVCGFAAPASAERVITLAPHITELVFAAGGGDQIVGTVTSSDYPEAARHVPRVGDGITLNHERIILSHPTLLIAWRRTGAALEIEPLAARLGARMAYSEPERLRDIPAEVRRLGHMVGAGPTADASAQSLEARIDALESRYAARSQVSVFIEVGSTPLYTIGGDPLVNDALRVCGAVNIYGNTAVPAPRVPIEGVLVQNPQLLVATARPGESVQSVQDRWADYGLKAAIQGHVHAADPDALFRPGPRFIDATEALCHAIDAVRDSTAAPPAAAHSH